ncbi:class I SAM-dependent methyltransferase [Ancylobacter moscoviensis]
MPPSAARSFVWSIDPGAVVDQLGMNAPLVRTVPLRRPRGSEWIGHIPFAFWLVGALRPRLFVELGAHSGASYAAFCQAIRELGLDSRAFAIDTWQGDEQAGFYGEDIHADLLAFNTAEFDGFSTLLRMTFDEALPTFADGSIDLLHIDGFHSYEAVRHDFESWRPKLGPNAVVLFHDSYEFHPGFGVYQLFAELSERYPHFEFHHGHGLGVIGMSDRVPEPLGGLLRPAGWKKGPFNGFRLRRERRIRAHFARLGGAVS